MKLLYNRIKWFFRRSRNLWEYRGTEEDFLKMYSSLKWYEHRTYITRFIKK